MADLIGRPGSTNLDALKRAGRERILECDKEAARDLLDDDDFTRGDPKRHVELWARKIRVEAELSSASALERCRKALENIRGMQCDGPLNATAPVAMKDIARAALQSLQEGSDGPSR